MDGIDELTTPINQLFIISFNRSSGAGRNSKGQKIGDVDMDTYKKMVVGQKAKPARSKSRKLSKSEE